MCFLFRNINIIPIVDLNVHTICLTLEGIAVPQTNWGMFQKLYIADKCCMKICPRAENGCINQIGQWQIVVISHQYLPIEGFNSYCEAKKHILPHLYL